MKDGLFLEKEWIKKSMKVKHQIEETSWDVICEFGDSRFNFKREVGSIKGKFCTLWKVASVYLGKNKHV